MRVPHAGCATFWIGFRYGKFLYPKLDGRDLNALDESVVELATRVFETDFVQACDWG